MLKEMGEILTLAGKGVLYSAIALALLFGPAVLLSAPFGSAGAAVGLLMGFGTVIFVAVNMFNKWTDGELWPLE